MPVSILARLPRILSMLWSMRSLNSFSFSPDSVAKTPHYHESSDL
jgi:hypothetical protein